MDNNVSMWPKSITWLVGISILVIPSAPLWSEENDPAALLPKESFEVLLKHAEEARDSSEKITAGLRLTAADERVLLHLPKRGFPWFATLLDQGDLPSVADSTLFMPDTDLPTCSREEGIVDGLLANALTNRVMANRYACFRLVKELAPSPEAMRLEKQAKELSEKIQSEEGAAMEHRQTGYPAEARFLETLESIRIFFDQLKGLPKMSSEEFAHERAESAVLAPREYQDGTVSILPDGSFLPDTRTWSEKRIDRQNHWDQEGFLVAYSQSGGPEDYNRFQIVIKPSGAIFAASQPYSGSHFGPDSYESKLPPADLRTLKDYLEKMTPSNASGKDIRCIVSFSKDGSWVTRTYDSLPAGEPFQSLLRRMFQQAGQEWVEKPPKSAEFLGPEQ